MVKTFLLVMIQFLKTKALVRVISLCKRDKNIFEIRLLNAQIVDRHLETRKQIKYLGQPFMVVVNQNTARRITYLKTVNTFHALKGRGGQVATKEDHDVVAQPQLCLEFLGLSYGFDPSFPDKSHLLAKNFRLLHVVSGHKDRSSLLLVEAPDGFPDPARYVRIETDGWLVEEEEFRVVDESLAEGKFLLGAGGEPSNRMLPNSRRSKRSRSSSILRFLVFLKDRRAWHSIRYFPERSCSTKNWRARMTDSSSG